MKLDLFTGSVCEVSLAQALDLAARVAVDCFESAPLLSARSRKMRVPRASAKAAGIIGERMPRLEASLIVLTIRHSTPSLEEFISSPLLGF
jgi:hypothetical protein